MASEGPPQSEEIVCVRIPCRDGRERVWRAIELLHQEQRPNRATASFTPVSTFADLMPAGGLRGA